MAPELLRAPRGSRLRSFAGDVYSFAIIMQEVMVRGTPFCMMDLPAKGKREVRKGYQEPTMTQIIRPTQAAAICQKSEHDSVFVLIAGWSASSPCCVQVGLGARQL